MKQLVPKQKNMRELTQENNPLYQVEIYNQEYQFVVNLMHS